LIISVRFRKALVFGIIIMLVGLSTETSSGNIIIKNQKNSSTTTSYNSLLVYFIDVGQGDCILIQTPENNFVLIDTGSRNYAYTVIDFLNSHSVSTLKAFIATHPHEDHIGGSEEIFNAFDILSVYHPGYPSNSQAYLRFLNAAQNEGCPIYTDDNVNPGDFIEISSYVSCQILNINKNASSENDASIVLRLDYDLISFLFTGDINGDCGDYVENYLVDNWDVNIDILKVTHHGSSYGSTNYLLDEATPETSIISCGAGNPYGHPNQETRDRLSEHNSTILRTDLNGNVTTTTDGLTYNITYEQVDEPLPPSIDGPKTGNRGVNYTFTFETSDPNGDDVCYYIDWGDGNVSDWIGPFQSGVKEYVNHTWAKDGAYVIKAKAKDIYNQESSWSFFNAVMPRDKELNKTFFFNLRNRLLSLFPMLRIFFK
jgi:beta-lactamase superfamily II metal-dependent hydrolase